MLLIKREFKGAKVFKLNYFSKQSKKKVRVLWDHGQDFEKERRWRRNVVEKSANVCDLVDGRRRQKVFLKRSQEFRRRLQERVVVVTNPVGQRGRPLGRTHVSGTENKNTFKICSSICLRVY